MLRRLVCLAGLLLAIVPSSAAAQGEDSEWASSSGGHMAFTTSDQDTGVSTLQFVGADGVQAPPEVVTDGYDDPLIALGARGDAILVWYDDDSRLWARYRPVGGVLGPREVVADGVDRDAEAIAVGLDGAGTATIVWPPEKPNETGGLAIVTRSESGSYSAPQAIAAYRVFAPDLAVTDNGSAVLAWRQTRSPKRPNGDQVAVSTRPAGAATFGAPVVVAGVQRNPSEPTVAANDRGDAIVGWSQNRDDAHSRDGVVFTVYGVFRAPGGGFGRTVKLNKTKDMGGPWAAVTSEGRMVLGWTDNLKRRAEVRVRSAAGVLGPPIRLTDDLEENSNLFPLPYGRGLIAWADRDPGVSTINVAQATEDLKLGPAQFITRVHGWFLGPSFATSPQGGLVTVPRPPLRTGDAIRWWRVPLQP
ncbi:hypothetical protein [Solirubrobacter ginsenosidimutans]|nr:hypothetical protein [Solirubrobacter ginsenosidimutans]